MREIEVKFLNINPGKVRKRLKQLGGKRTVPVTFFKELQFRHPDLGKRYYTLVRARSEGREVALTIKKRRSTKGFKIEDEFEVRTSHSLKEAKSFLEAMGFEAFRDREKFREEWRVGRVKVDIDLYPRINPYLEIEGPTQKEIKSLAEKLGFDFKDARSDTATVIIREAGLSVDKLLFRKRSAK